MQVWKILGLENLIRWNEHEKYNLIEIVSYPVFHKTLIKQIEFLEANAGEKCVIPAIVLRFVPKDKVLDLRSQSKCENLESRKQSACGQKSCSGIPSSGQNWKALARLPVKAVSLISLALSHHACAFF